jgi:DNA-binding response OmpR family regulator
MRLSTPTRPDPPTAQLANNLRRIAENRPVLLLVEDNRADIFLVERAMEFYEVPVRIMTVEDGEAAYEYLERVQVDNTVPCPRIVLLDLNLPKRSGKELLKRIRGAGRCQNVPVVVLTSSNSLEDHSDTERLGIDRYVTKPTTYNEFLKIGEVVNAVLQEHAACDV